MAIENLQKSTFSSEKTSGILKISKVCAPFFQNYTTHNDIDFFVLLESP
jgi:hypothetical protein